MKISGLTLYWKLYWLWVGITIGLYAALVFWAGPRLSVRAGGLTPLDLRMGGYDLAGAKELLGHFDAGNVGSYLNVWYPLDMTFLSFITLAMAAGLWQLFRRVKLLVRLAVTAIPLAYGLFDVFENNAVAALFATGADGLTTASVKMAAQFTQAKFVFFFMAVFFILFGLVADILARRKGL